MLEAKIDERLHWWKKCGEVFLAATGVKWQFWIEILAAALVSLWQICFTVFWPESYIIQILSVCPHAWKETGLIYGNVLVLFHHGLCSNYSSIAIVCVCACLCTRLLCAGLVMIGVSFDSRFCNPSSNIPLARGGVQKWAHESSRKYDFN